MLFRTIIHIVVMVRVEGATYTELECRLKGWHTIPLHAIAPVQYSTTSPAKVHRSNEVMGVVDILRTKGVAKVRNMIINLTFTPSHTHTAVQILKSGGYGNKRKTFHQVYPDKPSAYTKTNKIIHKTKKKK